MPKFVVIPPSGDMRYLITGESESEIWACIKLALDDAFLECVVHTCRPNMCVYIDEDSKLRRVPPPVNPRATALVPDLMAGDRIVGTAVFVGRDGVDEVDCPMSIQEIDHYLASQHA